MLKFIAGLVIGAVVVNKLKEPLQPWIDSVSERAAKSFAEYLLNNHGIVIYKEEN